ncbi:MAG: right-handed parallel beta-helix repeat-containing protein [Planctomycetota bacterium]|jgi:hypothetical protein
MRQQMTILGACFAALSILPAQRTLIVDDNGVADFKTIQAAVDAADPGDVVRIRHGRYQGVTINKGIRLLADPREIDRPGNVVLGRNITVDSVPREQVLVLAGMPSPWISVANCEGSVYLSHLQGPIVITNSEDVSLLNCTAIGDSSVPVRIVDSNVLDVDGNYVGFGGAGLWVERSNLTLVETQVRTVVVFGGSGLPVSFVKDSHVSFTPGTRIFPGGNPPAASYVLDGNNTAWQALHTLRVRESSADGRLDLEFETNHVAPHLMVGFSLANRPTRIEEGIFYLHHPSIRLIHSSVQAPNEPRAQSVLLPPEFSFEHRWLGIPITFQAAATDVNGKITLSAPYTMVF